MMRIITTALLLLIYITAFSHESHYKFDGNSDPALKTFIKDRKKTLNADLQKQLAQQPAWKSFLGSNGNWMVWFNEQTGKPRKAVGQPVSLGLPLNARAIADGFISQKLSGFEVPVSQLVFNNVASSTKYDFVNYKQFYNGVEVLWARMQIKMMHDGRIMQFENDVFNDISLNITPAISEASAVAVASQNVGITITQTIINSNLKIVAEPAGNKNVYHLVYEVNVKGTDAENIPRNYYTLVDAHSGEIIYRDNMVRHFANTDVTVTANLYATNPYNPSSIEPLKYLRVNDGATTYYTDNTGYLGLTNTTSFSATMPLRGQWARIYTNNVTPNLTVTLNPGTNNITYGTPANIKELSAYHAVQEVHDHFKAQHAGMPAEMLMDFEMTTNVDVAGSCNAFYDGDINFFDAGGTAPNICNATSTVADVVYHEYGHGINSDLYGFYGAGGMGNGAMNEGYADTWANGITDDPILGIGFYQNNPTGYVRSYNLRKVYPQDLQGEVHADGEIIAGAWWDLRLLMNDLAFRNNLFKETMPATVDGPNGDEGTIFLDVLIEALTADDNDGNISNGTPNYCNIVTAFGYHGIFLSGTASNVSHTDGIVANAAAPIVIDATIASPPPGFTISGNYRVNNSTTWIPFTLNNTGGNNWQGNIPPQNNGDIVYYYLGLANDCGVLINTIPARVTDANPNIPFNALVGFNLLNTDDFDNNYGNWNTPDPTDNASTGLWVIADIPIPSFLDPGTQSGMVQTDQQHTPGGIYSCFTGNANSPGDGAGTEDIDGGKTTLFSLSWDMSTYNNPLITYWRYYSNDQGATPETDYWQTAISNDGGATWVPVENINVPDHSYRRFAVKVTDYVTPTANVMMRFIAEDANAGSLIEAALDDYQIWDGLPVSVDNIETQNIFSLFPNPAKNQIRINYNVKTNDNISIVISDKIGKVVYSQKEEAMFGTGYKTVDLSKFANGIYTVSINGAKTNFNKKVSVVK
ncbi:MAG TPA: PepSY domain-containing protein [Bacteroidia bacterium]|nr:PepSY domain-containing protein [Bacteroidia bacterium]HNU33817.1 PepSY domain-containing protein [Bacteroidia bacterium]